MTPEVSIIIVNYNTGNLLYNCLKSIKANAGTGFEVIVADNNSGDGSISCCADFWNDGRFRLLQLDRNYGFSRANNVMKVRGILLHILESPQDTVGPDVRESTRVLAILCSQLLRVHSGRDLTNAEIDECNEKLMAMAGEEQVYYVDVASAIKDETGGLPAEFTTDGLHFKGEYYNKWIDYLKEHTVPET